jgi:hypothetical protein
MPATLVIGAIGIQSADILPSSDRINWGRLLSLPAFQLFASERGGPAPGAPLGEWLAIAARDAGAAEKVLDDYRQWHAVKGQWPGETPMGDLL